MAASPTWMSLTDLGRVYGISAIHCGRALKNNGWRDRFGQPTQGALQAGAASINGPLNHTNSSLWNTKICGALLEKTGYHQISRAMRVEQWALLLEAIAEGCPSIDITADQMAEEIPEELIEDINDELSSKNCLFRIKANKVIA